MPKLHSLPYDFPATEELIYNNLKNENTSNIRAIVPGLLTVATDNPV